MPRGFETIVDADLVGATIRRSTPCVGTVPAQC
jgi:hypothetical protein